MRNVEAIFIIRALFSKGFWALLLLLAMFGCVINVLSPPKGEIVCSGSVEYDLGDEEDLKHVRLNVSPYALQYPPCDLSGSPVSDATLDKIYRPGK